jgi:hypothetical protein
MQANAHVRERCCEHGAAAPAKNQPERPEKLRPILPHVPLLVVGREIRNLRHAMFDTSEDSGLCIAVNLLLLQWLHGEADVWEPIPGNGWTLQRQALSLSTFATLPLISGVLPKTRSASGNAHLLCSAGDVAAINVQDVTWPRRPDVRTWLVT